MLDYAALVFMLIIGVFIILMGINLNVTVNINRNEPEVRYEDLEDILFDEDGDFKVKEDATVDFNEALKGIHDFMVDGVKDE